MVFGTGKNGKSTMLNALLEEDLLPSATTTCTGNVIHIGPVKNADGEEVVKLHRRGDDEHEFFKVEPLPQAGDGCRMKSEWVTGGAAEDGEATDIIDRVEIEHKHEIFHQNLKILDVPGCAIPCGSCFCASLWMETLANLATRRLNQDSGRNEEVQKALDACDVLLITCSALSSTGGLTMEVRAASHYTC